MSEWSNPKAAKAAIKNLRQALRNRGEELEVALTRAAQAEAREAELREAALACRRSDGRGGLLWCWCDSERHYKNSLPREHAPYCLEMQNALRAARKGEGGST